MSDCEDKTQGYVENCIFFKDYIKFKHVLDLNTKLSIFQTLQQTYTTGIMCAKGGLLRH